MLTTLIIIGVLFVGLGSASLIHRHRQYSFLNKSLNVDESYKKRAAKELGIDGAIVTGVSTFDVLYNSLKISPETLSGINRLHHAQNFESLGDLMSFLKGEIIKSEAGEAAWRQMIHKYKGFTGEQTAFGNLTEQGFQINVPESATTEGLDVTIDGKAYNVKVTDNPSYIQQHLDKHPDIDVITNKEMAKAFGDHPRVKIDPDLSSQKAFHDTADTFEGVGDMGDLIDGIPIITLAINTVRNGKRAYDGKVDLKTATEHTVIDTVGVGAGGWAGGQAGLYAGLALAPVTGGTSAIIIPAATTLIGTIIGVFTGKGISGWFKGRHIRSAIKELQNLASTFRNTFLELYDQVVSISNNYFKHLLLAVEEEHKKEGFLKRTLFPNAASTFYEMANRKLKSEKNKTRNFYKDLKSTLVKNKESEGGMILYAQGIEILNEVEPLPNYYEQISQQLKVVEAEKNKLS